MKMMTAEKKIYDRLTPNRKYLMGSNGIIMIAGSSTTICLSEEEANALAILVTKGLPNPFNKESFDNACNEHFKDKLNKLTQD